MIHNNLYYRQGLWHCAELHCVLCMCGVDNGQLKLNGSKHGVFFPFLLKRFQQCANKNITFILYTEMAKNESANVQQFIYFTFSIALVMCFHPNAFSR